MKGSSFENFRKSRQGKHYSRFSVYKLWAFLWMFRHNFFRYFVIAIPSVEHLRAAASVVARHFIYNNNSLKVLKSTQYNEITAHG